MPRSDYFRRILGLVILIAALATVAVIVRYFIDSSRKDSKTVSSSFPADISMKAIHFTESRQNRKKWELFARSGSYDKQKETTSLEDVRFIVERDRKNGPLTVTARRGVYLHTPKTVNLEGNVKAVTEKGMTFETPSLSYDSAQQLFTTGERVKLTDEALSVEGTGMELSVDRQQAVVKSQVEATVYPGKGIR